MGLGPKYEGSFTPPALPVGMQEYSQEMGRYIQQLHNQLQIMFTKTQQVINQIIYEGDGDGGYTIGPETEEGGTVIVGRVRGSSVKGHRAFFLHPGELSSPAPYIADESSSLMPANKIGVWPFYIPFTFTITKIHVRAGRRFGNNDQMGVGLYSWDKAKITAAVFLITAGSYNTYSMDVSDVTVSPGLYRVAVVADTFAYWQGTTIQAEFRSLTANVMAADAFAYNDVDSLGDGVLPATLSTLSAGARPPPDVLFEGV